MPVDRDATILAVEGCRLRLTELRRVLWPASGVTKGDLLQYYADVSPYLLPHVAQRAVVLKRHPRDVRGPFFVMNRLPERRPPWLDVRSLTGEAGNVYEYPVIAGLASLLWSVNTGCIELSTLPGSRSDPALADGIRFELDGSRAPLATLTRAALGLRDALRDRGLTAFLKSGTASRFHVQVPLLPRFSQSEVARLARTIAAELARVHPGLITVERAPEQRPVGLVYIDAGANGSSAGAVAVYSLLPDEAGSVSMPIAWDDLERCQPWEWAMDSVVPRLTEIGDTWAGAVPAAASLAESASPSR